MGVDADAALEQTADAGPLMSVLIGAAAGREADAVGAQQKVARRQRVEPRRKLHARAHACFDTVGAGDRGQLESPAGRTTSAGREHRRALAVPGLPIAQATI